MTMPLGNINGKPINFMDFDKSKSIFDANSEFIKQLEIYKLKAETKPRKHNIMQSQDEFAEGCMEIEKKTIIVVPANYIGSKK